MTTSKLVEYARKKFLEAQIPLFKVVDSPENPRPETALLFENLFEAIRDLRSAFQLDQTYRRLQNYLERGGVEGGEEYQKLVFVHSQAVDDANSIYQRFQKEN